MKKTLPLLFAGISLSLCAVFFAGCGKTEVRPCTEPVNFHVVTENPREPDCTEYAEPDPGISARKHLVRNTPELSLYRVKEAVAYRSEFGYNCLRITMFPDDAKKFSDLTAKHAGRQIAIIIGGKLFCAPFVHERIKSDNFEISGAFSEAEAKALAEKLAPGGRKKFLPWMR